MFSTLQKDLMMRTMIIPIIMKAIIYSIAVKLRESNLNIYQLDKTV
jgi:hypothetical protein